MATVIDALVVTLGLDSSQFAQGTQKAGKEMSAVEQRAQKMGQAVNLARGMFVQLFTVLTGATGLTDLITQTVQYEAALGRLSRQIGQSTQDIQSWSNMAELAGGKAEELQSGMSGLAKEITNLKYNGEMGGQLTFLTRFGVDLVDVNGKLKDQSQIMLDLAKARERSGMSDADFSQNASLAGMNQSQINLMLQSSTALARQLEEQKKNALVTAEQAKQAQELSAEWTAMKQELGALARGLVHDLMPGIVLVMGGIRRVVTFLRDHKGLVYGFFIGLAIVMAPAVVSATALVIQFALLAAPIIAVGAAIGLLLDDLQTFADGGDSLIPWQKIFGGAEFAKGVIDDLIGSFGTLSKLIDAIKSGNWSEAAALAGKLMLDATPMGGKLMLDATPMGIAAKAIDQVANDGAMNNAVNDAAGTTSATDSRPVDQAPAATVPAAAPARPRVRVQPGQVVTSQQVQQARVQQQRQQVQRQAAVAGQQIGASAASSLNIPAVMNTLRQNAHATSKGQCAKYVRTALQAGGANMDGRPLSAKDYTKFLPKKGFTQVDSSTPDSQLQQGDVVVFPAVGKHKHGHIAIWDGKQWISDFKQKGRSVWRDAPNAQHFIYRAPARAGSQQSRSPASPARQPVAQASAMAPIVGQRAPSGSLLAQLADAVASGEGHYNSVNRGLVNGRNLGATTENLSNVTINEALRRNTLAAGDSRRMNAVGKYQIIASTMKQLKGWLKLSGEEKLTPEMQDKLFMAILQHKRPAIYRYITGQSTDINAALVAAAQEWASVGVPQAMRGAHRMVQAGESYYAGDGGNKSHTKSLGKIKGALENIRRSGGVSRNAQGAGARGQRAVSQGRHLTASNQTDVRIGQVTIHTQASDARSIAATLPAELQNVMAPATWLTGSMLA